MGIVLDSLNAALVASLLIGPSEAVLGAAVPVAAPAKAHRTHWDLAQYTWLRLVPREPGSAPNDAPVAVSAEALLQKLEPIRVVTPDGEEALFSAQELAFLAKAMGEALSSADPSEDLVLLSGSKRGAGFLSSPLAVTARLFMKDGRLNLIVQDPRLEVMGRYSPQSDWPKYEHGSRKAASKTVLGCPGAEVRRADWLVLAPGLPAAVPVATPAAAVPGVNPAPVALVPKAVGPEPSADPAARLRALKRLRDENLITEAEFQAKRGEIIKTL